MTDAKAPEPSIEEILASIRKIISDDEPDSVEPVPSPAEPEMVPEDDGVLHLTEMMEAVPSATMEAAAPPAPAYIEPEPVRVPQPVRAPESPPRAEPEYRPGPDAAPVSGLASERTVAAASGAFAKLTHPEPLQSHGGKSVEDIVREMLNPMLRGWIDENLAGIVERLVDRELKKISRKAEDS